MVHLKNRNMLPVLLNELNLTGFGAEVGVLKGEFSDVILRQWKGRKLYGIDAWRALPDALDNHSHQAHLDHYAAAFQKLYGYGIRSVLMRELSVAAANVFPDKYFDFVYIDAAHDAISVAEDLAAWFPKVRPGGVFAGHDYFDGKVEWKDATGTVTGSVPNMVKSVVDRYLSVHGLEAQSTTEDSFPTWWVKV